MFKRLAKFVLRRGKKVHGVCRFPKKDVRRLLEWMARVEPPKKLLRDGAELHRVRFDDSPAKGQLFVHKLNKGGWQSVVEDGLKALSGNYGGVAVRGGLADAEVIDGVARQKFGSEEGKLFWITDVKADDNRVRTNTGVEWRHSGSKHSKSNELAEGDHLKFRWSVFVDSDDHALVSLELAELLETVSPELFSLIEKE